MRSILNDLRYALRQLRKSPGFAFTAATVLALGIGANIAVFTILDGILLRPLPYAQPDRVVTVKVKDYPMSYANILQLRDAMGTRLQIAAVMNDSEASVVSSGGRFQIQQSQVTAGLMTMLGVAPLKGRVFRQDENDPGNNRVALLGEDTWRRLFNADPMIVGKNIYIKEVAYTIVGVMPKGFSFPYGEAMQVWSPAEIKASGKVAMSGDEEIFGELYARLPDGMTIAQLAAGFDRTQAVIAKQNPWGVLPSRVEAIGYRQSLIEDARKPLMLLYAVVFAIWALACLNVTSLLLARAVARVREQAVRAALGASRARLLQQAIVESMLLSGIGGVAGFLLGESAIKLLWRQIDRNLLLTRTIYVEWRVLVGMAALTVATSIVVGVFPAWRAWRRNVQQSLQGVNATASAGQSRTREALVVAQLALTLVFLVGAGLFLRTIHALRQVPLGFSQQNVLTGGIVLNGAVPALAGSATETNIIRTSYEPLLARLRAIPGVKDAALSSVLPLRREFSVGLIVQIDHKKLPPAQAPRAGASLASAGLASALGIPMVRGRFFTEDDTAAAPVVALINKAFADKYLPATDPVGHTLSMGEGKFADIRIVGVIGDMKQNNVTDAIRPEVYFCLAQMQPGTPMYGVAAAFMEVAIRAAIPADTLRAQFDKAIHEVAPDATTTDVKTIHEAVEDSFGSQTLIAHLLECFGALALMIATVGLYGLLSFAVAQRTREIGLRIALGAPQGNILSLILRRALLLITIGVSIGGVLAWFAVKFTSGYIYGVKAHDALTFTSVVVVLAAASFLAAWLPARRASAVDPILALRSE
ncbi:MAG TPA: ABC transporter permease [Terracidiphilus sp.]|nr:ABC transporter permease [Terracidiphilus sp.]